MKWNEFGRKFLRRVGEALSLIEKPNGECIFWDSARGCKVYAHRPDQCRSFPFWPEVLESREAWEAQAVRCPGMNTGELRHAENAPGLSPTGGSETRWACI